MSGLHPFDIFTIVVCGLMLLWGGIHGMFSQIMSIVTLIISWIAASHYYPLISPYIPLQDPFKDTVAMLAFFAISLLVTRLASKFICGLLSFRLLKEFDRQLGAFFGLLKGFVICMVVAFFAVTSSEAFCKLVIDSPSGRLMVRAISKVEQIIPDDKNHEKIHAALDEFSKTIDNSDFDQQKADEEFAAAKQKLSDWFQDNTSSKLGPETKSGDKKSGGGSFLDDFENLFHNNQKEKGEKQTSSLKDAMSSQIGQQVVAQVAQQNPNLSAALSSLQSGSTAAGAGTAASGTAASTAASTGELTIMEDDPAALSTSSVLDRQNFSPFSTAPPF